MSRFKDIRKKSSLCLFLLASVLLLGVGHSPLMADEQVSATDDSINSRASAALSWPEEEYSQVFTNEMAQEIAAWVLASYPELPFTDPTVEIHEDGIVCRGNIEVFGIDVAASGRVSVFLEDGKLNGVIEEIHVAGMQVPSMFLDAIDDARRLYESVTWDIVVTNVELREGEMLVEGIYK